MAYTNFGLPIGAATALSYRHDFGADMNRLLAVENTEEQRKRTKMQQDEAQMRKIQFDQVMTQLTKPDNAYYSKAHADNNESKITRIGEIKAIDDYYYDKELVGEMTRLVDEVNNDPLIYESKSLMEEKQKAVNYMNQNPDAYDDPAFMENMNKLYDQLENGVKKGDTPFIFSPAEEFELMDEVFKATEQLKNMDIPVIEKSISSNMSGLFTDYDSEIGQAAIDNISGVLYEKFSSRFDRLARTGYSGNIKTGKEIARSLVDSYKSKALRNAYHNQRAQNPTPETLTPSPYDDHIVDDWKNSLDYMNLNKRDPNDKSGIKGSPNPKVTALAPTNSDGFLVNDIVYAEDRNDNGKPYKVDLNSVVPDGQWKPVDGQYMVYDPDYPDLVRYAKYGVVLQQEMKDIKSGSSTITVDQQIESLQKKYPNLDIYKTTYKEVVDQIKMPGYTGPKEYRNVPTIGAMVMTEDKGKKALEYDGQYLTPSNVGKSYETSRNTPNANRVIIKAGDDTHKSLYRKMNDFIEKYPEQEGMSFDEFLQLVARNTGQAYIIE